MSETQITELIARSNRLGADPRNTNFAGGNTSAKGAATDPVTGEDVELMWVKGSGGDLGTLRAAGLAVPAPSKVLPNAAATLVLIAATPVFSGSPSFCLRGGSTRRSRLRGSPSRAGLWRRRSSASRLSASAQTSLSPA